MIRVKTRRGRPPVVFPTRHNGARSFRLTVGQRYQHRVGHVALAGLLRGRRSGGGGRTGVAVVVDRPAVLAGITAHGARVGRPAGGTHRIR